MNLALKLSKLKKKYNKLTALQGIDLEVEKGDFFGLLGPNGAGKSTAINIICSLVQKNSGTVQIYGEDLEQNPSIAKSYLGIVPQEFNFSIFETPTQILIDQAGFYGVPRKEAVARAKKLLALLNLSSKAGVAARTLSGGMKRRLMIARALMHDPKVLILDEPTAGVDIEIRHSVWAFLKELNKQGLTIILTTHYLEEAELLCNKIAIIDSGKIIENATTREILKKMDGNNLIIELKNPLKGKVAKSTFQLQKIDALTIEATVAKTQSLFELFDHLRNEGLEISDIRNKSNRLEQLFLKLTKKTQK